jgi:NRPS condensation-like uncharacterized protein
MTYIKTPFSPIDEILALTDSDAYPVNVHIEARAPGTIDAACMREAVAAAIAIHPLARARRLPPAAGDKQIFWEVHDAAGIDPLQVFEAGDDESVDRVRSQFLSARVPLHESPPLRIALVRRAGGDHLILNVNHAAADGIGTLRFLRSVLRAYSGEADDTGAADPLTARDVESLYAPTTRADKLRRFKTYAASLKTHLPAPTSVAVVSETDRIAYGCLHYTLSAEDVAELNPKRHINGTFNDLLVAAMHRTVQVWNDQQDTESALVRVTSPVNLRPKDWWYEVFGNFAMSFATNTEPRQREEPDELMKAVLEQSNLAKEEGFAQSMLLGLGLSSKLPFWAKNLMFQNPGGSSSVTSAALTNAGRISEPLVFGELGEATEVWMSPPAVMPDGIGLGVTSYNGNMHLSFRHCYELLDDAGAQAFAELFHESLRWLS